MGSEFDRSEELHFLGFYLGVVVDNADPLGLGRVRFRIVDLIEPKSAWAFPQGTVGGGSAQRGFYDPPDIGAEIGVQFISGDVDAPVYWSGHWGVVDGVQETPGPAKSLQGEEATRVKAYETARFQMVWDERPGDVRWYVTDKETGDILELDESAGFGLQTNSAVAINAVGEVDVSGSQIKLNGAVPVGRVGDAVQVTIPLGAVMVPNPVTGAPTPNPIPIPLSGTIVAGSGTVKAG